MLITAADGNQGAIVAEAAVRDRLLAALVLARNDLLPVLPNDQVPLDRSRRDHKPALLERERGQG